jgi:RNA polymerase sigma-70 factor (ECF subfamily)
LDSESGSSEFESSTQLSKQSDSALELDSSPSKKPLDENSLRMNKEILTEHFTANRERLWRTIQVRMDPRLYGRVDPDDILQEAYLDAIKRVGHFAEEVNFTPFVWLRLIVGQTLVNVHRRHINVKMRDASRERSIDRGLRHEWSATSQSMAFQLAASQTSPSEAIVRTEEVGELAVALDSLSDIDREILTLRHFEDLSNKEVAELLEIEQKAASIRYVRAIQRLKKCLGNTDFPG